MSCRRYSSGRTDSRRHRAAVVVCLLVAASARADVVALRSWTQFSGFFPGDAVGAEWYTTSDARHAVTIGQVRDAGLSTWEVVYLRHDQRGMTAHRIESAPHGMRLGKALVRSVGGRLTVALTAYSPERGVPHRLLFYDLDQLLANGLFPNEAAGSVEITGFVREADWDLVAIGDETWLVRASGARLVASVVDWHGTETVEISGPWDLMQTDASVSVPAFSYDERTGSLAAAWIEPSPGGETVMRAGFAAHAAPGMALATVGEVPFGFGEPFRPVAGNVAESLGTRVTFDARRSIAVHQEETRLWVAGSSVVRRRSSLSDYYVQPTVVEFAIDSDDSRPARVIEIGEPAAGVVDGSFQLVRHEHGLAVAFLREYPGADVRSVFHAQTLDGGQTSQYPNAIIETTRRVTSPHLLEDARAAVWIQFDPNRNAWQAAYQDDRRSYLGTIGIPWRGNAGETVSAAVFSIPLAVLLTFYWATFANAPLIALIVALALLLFRFAPRLVRERYLPCLAAMLIVTVALAGDPVVSFGGPQPGLVSRALGALLVLGAAAWERRQIRSAPEPGTLIGWSCRALVVVLALSGYATTLALVA